MSRAMPAIACNMTHNSRQASAYQLRCWRMLPNVLHVTVDSGICLRDMCELNGVQRDKPAQMAHARLSSCSSPNAISPGIPATAVHVLLQSHP
jgi:hypothetical protein